MWNNSLVPYVEEELATERFNLSVQHLILIIWNFHWITLLAWNLDNCLVLHLLIWNFTAKSNIVSSVYMKRQLETAHSNLVQRIVLEVHNGWSTWWGFSKMLNTDFTLISCFCKEFWRYFDSTLSPLPILERFERKFLGFLIEQRIIQTHYFGHMALNNDLNF